MNNPGVHYNYFSVFDLSISYDLPIIYDINIF